MRLWNQEDLSVRAERREDFLRSMRLLLDAQFHLRSMCNSGGHSF